MERETIKNILDFLNTKENKKLPKKWFDSVEKLKLIQELENHPDGIQYKHRGSLDLNKSKITKLPNDLYVDGYLNLRYCQYLTELPNNLYVGGYFNLDGCKQITDLPNNLYIGGDLVLFSSQKLIELPENLYVGRDVYIYDTLLAEKYTNEEIREIVTSKGGKIEGQIIR